MSDCAPLDRVLAAHEARRLRLGVEQQPGRAGVAVARLPDRPGVEQLFAGQRDFLVGLGLAALEARLDQGQRELYVAVADEREIRRLGLERRLRDVGRQDVFPDRIANRAVEERDAGPLALGREPGQELELLLGEHAARPACGHAGVRGELVDVERARDDEVVVAAEADRSALAYEREAFARLRAVADDVAEAPQLVDVRSSRRARARPPAPAGCRGRPI